VLGRVALESPGSFLDGSTKSSSKTKKASLKTDEMLASLSEAGIKSEDVNRPAKQFLIDVYKQLQEGNSLPVAGIDKKSIKKADTIRSFTAKVPKYEGKGQVKFTFNLSSVASAEKVRHAELHVRPIAYEHDEHEHRLKVNVFSDVGRIGKTVIYKLFAQTKTYGGYLVFDITKIIEDVLQKTKSNHERIVKINIKHEKSHKKQKRAAGLPIHVTEDDSILILYTQNKGFFKNFNTQINTAASSVQAQRGKRHVKRNVDKKQLCSKQELIINFKTLGWNEWIIFPRSFNAFMCDGRCPSPIGWSMDPTNHSILQSLMRISNNSVPKSCCVPTKLEPINMMYYENNELVIRQHEDMSVSTCGCR
jgi:nodal